MEFNVASPFEAITGSIVLLDGSLPYPKAMVVLPNTTSQSTDVLTSVTSSTDQQTQHVGSLGYDGGIPTIATVTHSCSPGISMKLSLLGSRPPSSYCGFTLPASANNPMSCSRPPGLRYTLIQVFLVRLFQVSGLLVVILGL